LGVWGWGIAPIPNPQSPIPNPQSPLILVINKILNYFEFINLKLKIPLYKYNLLHIQK
jgi:hypothetical protein